MECCLSCVRNIIDRNGVGCSILYPLPVTIGCKCSCYFGKFPEKYFLTSSDSNVHITYTCYLRKYRQKYGLSQIDLAFFLGTSQNTISNLECGLYRPNIELAFKIGRFFHCSPFEVFEFKEVKE